MEQWYRSADGRECTDEAQIIEALRSGDLDRQAIALGEAARMTEVRGGVETRLCRREDRYRWARLLSLVQPSFRCWRACSTNRSLTMRETMTAPFCSNSAVKRGAAFALEP